MCLSVCLCVCLVRALTFESLRLETPVLLRRYTSKIPSEGRVSRSSGQGQGRSRVVRLRLKDNFVYIKSRLGYVWNKIILK